MGLSTDGEISYGILFDEEYEFPWNNDEHTHDIDDWWRIVVLKFKPSFQIYDEDGEYLNGIEPSKEDFDKWWKERSEFDKNNVSCPYETINYCSGDYPAYILAIKRTRLTANRGYPTKFDPSLLKITESDTKDLIDFCNKYNIVYDDSPKWYLSSYMG